MSIHRIMKKIYPYELLVPKLINLQQIHRECRDMGIEEYDVRVHYNSSHTIIIFAHAEDHAIAALNWI